MNPKKIWRNQGALPGDHLILTKTLGSGDLFRGVIDRKSREVVLFSRAERGKQSEEQRLKIDDPKLISSFSNTVAPA